VYTDMEHRTEIRRAVLVDGLSKRQACLQFNIHFNTLQKILDHPAPPGYQRVAKLGRPVIGPWLDRLRELLEDNRHLPRKQRYTVKRMWDVLKDEGFAGGYTTVRDTVRQMRAEAPKEVFMPLTQPPGEAQVDFGYALACIGGQLTKITFFVMSLVHSDAMFVMAFPRECTEVFGEAHAAAFGFFGFVPKRISYDNTRVAVAKILGAHARKLTVGFGRLVSHYLFEPHFCRVRRANEKGVVEGTVRYSRQNFMVPVPQAADYGELNAYLLDCCRSDMARRLRGKTLPKRELLKDDRIAGLLLPKSRFDSRKLVSTTASSEALVRFDTNDYSVPVACGHKPVVLKASADTVFVYHQGREIARHDRCWLKEKQIFEPLHYLRLLERKPGSLDHARPLADWNLPAELHRLRRRLEAHRDDGTLEYIRVLMLLQKYPMDRLVGAIRRLDCVIAPTADAIRQWLIPAQRPELLTFSLDGREHLAGVKVAGPDLQGYRKLQEAAHV
jgi:transposase